MVATPPTGPSFFVHCAFALQGHYLTPVSAATALHPAAIPRPPHGLSQHQHAALRAIPASLAAAAAQRSAAEQAANGSASLAAANGNAALAAYGAAVVSSSGGIIGRREEGKDEDTESQGSERERRREHRREREHK